MSDTGWKSPGTVVDVNPIIDSYSESNYSSSVTVISGSKEVSACGQSFTGSGSVLKSAQFYLRKNGSPTGNAYVKIYAETHSTAFGTDSLPTGSVLATSNALDVSTLTSSIQLKEFTFSGTGNILLSSGTKYIAVIEYTNGNPWEDNILVGLDGTSPAHSGNGVYYDGSWHYNNSIDYCFYIKTDNVGTKAWSNPSNAKANDSTYAELGAMSSTFSYSHYLKATNFGFNVPSGATITGIEAQIKRGDVYYYTYDENVRLVLSNGSIGSENKAKTTTEWGSIEYIAYGGSSDLWSETLSASDINDTDFGLVLSIKLSDDSNGEIGNNEYVDHIQMKVYYTEGTEANSERKLYAQGRLTGNSEKKLYTRGFNTGNSNRPLYAQGTLEGSRERGLYLRGYLTDTSNRVLYIEGYAGDYYSKGSTTDLESDDTPLETQFSEQDYTTVRTDDDNYVDLQGTAQYMKFLFKELNENETNEQKFTITWRGKSSLAPSSAAVYLQVYNRTSGQWETLDSDSTTSANTKFTLTGTKSTNLSGYYDSNYVISVRVYQDVT